MTTEIPLGYKNSFRIKNSLRIKNPLGYLKSLNISKIAIRLHEKKKENFFLAGIVHINLLREYIFATTISM